MGGAEVCVTATRFEWISEVWVARFRGFAPTATVVPALRASELGMSGPCGGSVNPAIHGASDSVLSWFCGAAFVGAGEAGGWVMMGGMRWVERRFVSPLRGSTGFQSYGWRDSVGWHPRLPLCQRYALPSLA